LPSPIDQVLASYPAIFFACHSRHAHDPANGEMVSEVQAQILDHLDEVTPWSLSDLAHHRGVTPGTMSLHIDRLVKRGFVTRTPHATDKRRVLLRLTPAGARVSDAHSVLDPALVSEMLAQLAPDQRDRALEGLTLLATAANAAVASRAAAHRDAHRSA
jgi:DNA-binding MarR family transcriptional regulator